jgi:hypothetical protein
MDTLLKIETNLPNLVNQRTLKIDQSSFKDAKQMKTIVLLALIAYTTCAVFSDGAYVFMTTLDNRIAKYTSTGVYIGQSDAFPFDLEPSGSGTKFAVAAPYAWAEVTIYGVSPIVNSYLVRVNMDDLSISYHEIDATLGLYYAPVATPSQVYVLAVSTEDAKLAKYSAPNSTATILVIPNSNYDARLIGYTSTTAYYVAQKGEIAILDFATDSFTSVTYDSTTTTPEDVSINGDIIFERLEKVTDTTQNSYLSSWKIVNGALVRTTEVLVGLEDRVSDVFTPGPKNRGKEFFYQADRYSDSVYAMLYEILYIGQNNITFSGQYLASGLNLQGPSFVLKDTDAYANGGSCEQKILSGPIVFNGKIAYSRVVKSGGTYQSCDVVSNTLYIYNVDGTVTMIDTLAPIASEALTTDAPSSTIAPSYSPSSGAPANSTTPTKATDAVDISGNNNARMASSASKIFAPVALLIFIAMF